MSFVDGMLFAHEILEESRAARARYARDLAQHDLDERAFDIAIEAWDRTRRRSYDPLGARPEEAWHDAELEALQAFLSTYLSEAGRS